MKLKDRMKITKRNSNIAYIVSLITIVYLLMTAIKGVNHATDHANFYFFIKLNNITEWIMYKTAIYPISYIWGVIPHMVIKHDEPLVFAKLIIPPSIILLICVFFIDENRRIVRKFFALKEEVEKELNLRELKKESGLLTQTESASIEILIENKQDDSKNWHSTWWGQIVIGVSLAIILALFGLN